MMSFVDLYRYLVWSLIGITTAYYSYGVVYEKRKYKNQVFHSASKEQLVVE